MCTGQIAFNDIWSALCPQKLFSVTCPPQKTLKLRAGKEDFWFKILCWLPNSFDEMQLAFVFLQNFSLRTARVELVAGCSLYAGLKKTSKESRNRLVIQMTLYFAFLFLFPFSPLPLVALSQSPFLSFYSTFPPLTSSVSLHTNGKRELRVTCAGSCFFASAWSNFYANETLNKIRQSARAASPTQTLRWEGLPASPSVSIRSCGYLSFIHSLSFRFCQLNCL